MKNIYLKRFKPHIFIGICFIIGLFGCRDDDPVLQPTKTVVTTENQEESIQGFYLLNQGNMGSNKATLDYFDYTTGIYTKNIYAATNPNVVSELGDVGNDLAIYGNKLYAVINCSNFVEVMDAKTAKHIGSIEIPNCRYITFYNGKAYVSSYAGPVQVGSNNDQIGYVAEIDTATLQITRTVTVGYQPEEIAVVNKKLYVANSGGYRVPNYDSTISVIDLSTFTEIKKIDVAINLHRLKADKYGDLYVTSRGDYYDVPSNLYVIDTENDCIKKNLNIAASNIAIAGDSAYIYSTAWSSISNKNVVSFGIINVKTEEIITRNFISDGTDAEIEVPYGIAVNPITKEIFVTDAKSYVIPGTLFCFNSNGTLKWSVTTGDVPAQFAFLWK